MQGPFLDAVYAAIDQINRQNAHQKPVRKEPETALYGSSSDLDSLDLINLVVAVEQQIEQRFGVALALADDRALSQEVSPFTTVRTLAEYIAMLFEERQRA
jgi:acyl carrier protein